MTTAARTDVVMELNALQSKMRDYIAETHPSLNDQLELSLMLKLIEREKTFLSFLLWMMEKEQVDGTETRI